jgi:hypothetical protein
MRDAMPVDAMPGCHASCPAASIYVCDVDALVQSGVIRRGRVLCIRLEHLPRGLAASSAGRLATFGLCCCCCMAAVCCCGCWLLPESRRTAVHRQGTFNQRNVSSSQNRETGQMWQASDSHLRKYSRILPPLTAPAAADACSPAARLPPACCCCCWPRGLSTVDCRGRPGVGGSGRERGRRSQPWQPR